MNSILNSISSGDLQVQQSPRDIPIKQDSIINLFQNSEIEFKTCPEFKKNLENFNTGFGENNDLHYESLCKSPELKTPLYQENFLREFVTEEEKAAARHALGLYNKDDVVMMSLLTAEDQVPNQNIWKDVSIKQMRKGDQFFTPYTQIKAVYDNDGISLETKLKDLNKLISNHQKEISNIINTSNSSEITSLGDVKQFLKGFDNKNTLKETINEIDQKILRFDITGEIN